MLISEAWWHHSGFEIEPCIGTIMRLFNVYVRGRNLPMAFVSLGTKVKPWPEVCICTSAMHGDHGAMLRSHCWSEFVCLVCQTPSQLCLCHGCPRKPSWIPSSGSHPCSSPQPSLKPARQGSSLLIASLPTCGATASFPFLLFDFPKCLCANTTGFLFQPDKKWLFLLQCVCFSWVRNCDFYIHFFIPCHCISEQDCQ